VLRVRIGIGAGIGIGKVHRAPRNLGRASNEHPDSGIRPHLAWILPVLVAFGYLCK
jgi:hypothetical protein